MDVFRGGNGREGTKDGGCGVISRKGIKDTGKMIWLQKWGFFCARREGKWGGWRGEKKGGYRRGKKAFFREWGYKWGYKWGYIIPILGDDLIPYISKNKRINGVFHVFSTLYSQNGIYL